MNLFKIIQDIEQVDPEVYGRINSRRSVFNLLGKAALAAAPLAASAVFQKAYGKSADAITDILNYALTLEYLEDEFYRTALTSTILIPQVNRTAFAQISKHEEQHVAFLKGALGSNAIAKPTFDFTAKGNFPDVFTNYETFKAVAQVFEDTGVRAYKGQAANLIGNKDVLTYALQVHSVEARHASFVRRLRGQKGWIIGNNGGGVPSVAATSYAGEDNTTQGGLAKAAYASTYSDAAISEAFDEPLTREQVVAIVTPFFA